MRLWDLDATDLQSSISSNFNLSDTEIITDSFPPRQTPQVEPLVLTSSGSHCSGRYASSWNALLLRIDFCIDSRVDSPFFYFC